MLSLVGHPLCFTVMQQVPGEGLKLEVHPLRKEWEGEGMLGKGEHGICRHSDT